MTLPASPRLNPADRVRPARPAAAKPAARPAAKAPVRTSDGPSAMPAWLLPAGIALGAACLLGGSAGTYFLMSPGREVEAPARPRLASLKVGPLVDMPDLRDGVPALMAKAKPAPTSGIAPVPQAKADPPSPPPAVPDDANHKAMASTIVSANLRPALGGPSPQIAATARAEAVRPASASAKAEPSQAIDVRKPVATAAPGRDAKAATASVAIELPAPATVAMPEPARRPAMPEAPRPTATAGPLPPPAAAPPAAETESPAAATVPSPTPVRAAAPLPPPRPIFQAAAPPVERAAPQKPKPAANAPARPAPVQSASAEPRPAAQPAEEDRSVLGIPVPKFVPTGRDIRDAATSLTDAVTSLPSRF